MDAAQESLNSTMGLLGKPGVAPKDVVRRMQEIVNPVDVSILKTGRGLSRALAELEDARDNILPLLGAAEPHYLLKLTEARAMTLLTEMYLKAALAARESRCGHFREDYPAASGSARLGDAGKTERRSMRGTRPRAAGSLSHQALPLLHG